MQTKLTLRLDSTLIEVAKLWAHESGKSLSQVVADYFKLLSEKHAKLTKGKEPLPPITKALSGILKDATLSEEDYKKYLEEKHS